MTMMKQGRILMIFRTNKIRERREESKMTQGYYAELLGLSQVSVSKYENGHTLPRVDRAIEMARVLGTTVEDLWG